MRILTKENITKYNTIMNENEKNERSKILKIANDYFNNQEYEKALDLYEQFAEQGKLENKLVQSNITLAKKRLNSKEENKIKVSIIMVTYNQERYVDQALKALVEQKVDFKFEIIIGDDASTDNTPQIVKKYAESYPEIIVPVIRSKNLGPAENAIDLLKRVKGKYIVSNDGDDYVIDRGKLKKQAKILDENPDISVCFHKVKIINEEDSSEASIYPEESSRILFDTSDLIKGNFASNISLMYRRSAIIPYLAKINEKAFPLDHYLFFLASLSGKIYMLQDVMAVYRKNSSGVFSSLKSGDEILLRWGISHIHLYKEFLRYYKGDDVEIIHKNIKHILSRLVENSIETSDEKCLDDLYANFKVDVGKYFNDNYFIEIPEEVNLGLSNHLRKTNKITVVVMAYNHKDSILDCVNSVLNQIGFFSLEIIIGNDASLDGTGLILEKEYGKLNNIIIKNHKKNIGLQHNLKYCLEIATGDYIAFCEGDDKWLSRYKLNKLMFFIKQSNNCDAVFNWMLLNLNDKYYLPHEGQSKLMHGSTISNQELLFDNVIGNFSCCFYTKKAVRSVPEKYFEEKLSSDWIFNLIISSKFNIKFYKQILSEYKINPKGLWSSLSAKQQREARIAAVDAYQKINEISEIKLSCEKVGEFNMYFSAVQQVNYLEGVISLVGWMFLPKYYQYEFCKKTIKVFLKEVEVASSQSESIMRSDVSIAYSDYSQFETLYSGFNTRIVAELTEFEEYDVYVSVNNLKGICEAKVCSLRVVGGKIECY